MWTTCPGMVISTMSNQQWPSAQRPGRDPRQPFGAPAPDASHQPQSIENYQAPKGSPGRGLLVGVVALAVVGGLLIGLQHFSSEAKPTPSASGPGPATAASSLGAGKHSIPFEGNGKGTFEVLSSSWGEDEVEVRIRITLDEGQASFQVAIFNNQTMQSTDPAAQEPIRVKAGEPVEKTVRFLAPKADYTVVLTNGTGKDALTALPLPQ